MPQLPVVNAPLTQAETDHAARIVENLLAKGGLSYPKIAQRLGYASHAQLVRLVKHRKRIGRDKYDALVRWSNGEPPPTPRRTDLARAATEAPMQTRPKTRSRQQARSRVANGAKTRTRVGSMPAKRPSLWAKWARRFRALAAVIA